MTVGGGGIYGALEGSSDETCMGRMDYGMTGLQYMHMILIFSR